MLYIANVQIIRDGACVETKYPTVTAATEEQAKVEAEFIVTTLYTEEFDTLHVDNIQLVTTEE